MNKPQAIAVVSFIILVSFGISRASSQSLDQTFSVNSGGTLYIDSDSGSIDIASHDASAVDVQVFKKGSNADDFEVSVEQDGDDVRIQGDKNSSWGFGGFSLSVKYVIKVPASYNLDLKTGGGSIHIEDLNGDVDAKTSGGSISLGEIAGDIDVKTSGGAIRIEDVAGNVDAHTSGGSVKAKLSKPLTEDCKLTTSGGSITVYLTPSIAVDLQASTSGGRVKSEFEVDGVVKKTRISGSINGGGPLLKLRTSGGSVSIKQL